MAARLYDAFGRNASTTVPIALGVSDSGQAWEDLSSDAGAVAILGNRVSLSTTAQRSISVLDAGSGGGNGRLSASLIGTGGGLGLYFRVTDFNNWFRAFQRVFTYQYQTGTETYLFGYQQVYVGTETYISGYTQVETGTNEVLVGYNYSTSWAERRISDGVFQGAGYSRTNTYPTQGYPSPQAAPGNYAYGVNYSNTPVYRYDHIYSQQPIYSERAVYQQQPIYSERPTYAFTTGYELRIERSLAGAMSTKATRQINGPFSNISVTMKGDKIDASAGGSLPLSTIDETHMGATKHGIGIGKPSEALNQGSNFIDDFLFTPELTGGYQPSVLL